ncbi:hypothetical protein [Kutzneria sp. NPDC051319]|uniref:hypothetical protein n=1 Tax=Kutzneria sp. NPDC051319 TaxID=3155047 RepID=UPI00341EC8F1
MTGLDLCAGVVAPMKLSVADREARLLGRITARDSRSGLTTGDRSVTIVVVSLPHQAIVRSSTERCS